MFSVPSWPQPKNESIPSTVVDGNTQETPETAPRAPPQQLIEPRHLWASPHWNGGLPPFYGAGVLSSSTTGLVVTGLAATNPAACLPSTALASSPPQQLVWLRLVWLLALFHTAGDIRCTAGLAATGLAACLRSTALVTLPREEIRIC